VQFLALEPCESGLLDVGDGHEVYWESCGNPAGTPALFLHGGPGSGCSSGQRRFFDPSLYRAVLFDQRGSGRSRPLASSPDACLSTNTTAHLVADIEMLRVMLDVDRWTVLGLSWGTILGLAYAEAHPHRVKALVLAFVSPTSRREVQWITEDVGRIFPREWDRFANAVPEPRWHPAAAGRTTRNYRLYRRSCQPCGGRRSPPNPGLKFADSPLEGAGFEPSVPRRGRRRLRKFSRCRLFQLSGAEVRRNPGRIGGFEEGEF
jgi:pimeloyl-ACP methyl ester carboxylesterase